MEEHELLIRHASAWAAARHRPLEPDLVSEALHLREQHDGLPATEWPAGSGERLMLVTWPAYGPVPRPDALLETLDTFWSFLRATGRMSARSASPADLRKEGRRAAPRMLAAYDDPARHSQGRVLADFGRTIGVDLTDAADIEELTARMQVVQEAWNRLPQEERVRLMPDPSPKGLRAAAFTDEINAARATPEQVPVTPDDLAQAAEDARGSGFVQTCLRLVDWLGDGRAVTAAGLLRPAVAREAYRHLDLWPWERAWHAARLEHPDRPDRHDPAADDLRADLALHAWRSAGDCFALDRLWYALEATDLVEVRTTRVVPRAPAPLTDEEWVVTALTLLIAEAMRVDGAVADCLRLVVESAVKGPCSVDRLRREWVLTLPEQVADLLADYWETKFVETMFVFGDSGLWAVEGGRLRLTMLGLLFVGPFSEAVADGRMRGLEDFY